MSTEKNATPPYVAEYSLEDLIDALVILLDSKERCLLDDTVSTETYQIISNACDHVAAPLPPWVFYAMMTITRYQVTRFYM